MSPNNKDSSSSSSSSSVFLSSCSSSPYFPSSSFPLDFLLLLLLLSPTPLPPIPPSISLSPSRVAKMRTFEVTDGLFYGFGRASGTFETDSHGRITKIQDRHWPDTSTAQNSADP